MVDEPYVSLDWFYDEIKATAQADADANELHGVPLGLDSPGHDDSEPSKNRHYVPIVETSNAGYDSVDLDAVMADFALPIELQQQSAQFEYNPNEASQPALSYHESALQLNIDFGMEEAAVPTSSEVPMDIPEDYGTQHQDQQYSQNNAQMEWMQIDQSNIQMPQSVVYTSSSQQMLRIPDSSQQGVQTTYNSQSQQIMSAGPAANTVLTNMAPIQQIHTQNLNQQQQQQSQVQQFEINNSAYVTQQIFVDQQNGQQHFLQENPDGNGYQQPTMVQMVPQNMNMMQQNTEQQFVQPPEPQQQQPRHPPTRPRAKPQNRSNSRKKPAQTAQTSDSLIKGQVEVRMNEDMQMKLIEMSTKMSELTQQEAMGQDVSQEKMELDKQMAEMLNGCLKGAISAPAPPQPAAPTPMYHQPQATFIQQPIPQLPTPKPAQKKKPTKAELQRKQVAANAVQKPQPVQTIEMPIQGAIPVDINNTRFQGPGECYLLTSNGQLTKAMRVLNTASNAMTYQIQGAVDQDVSMMINNTMIAQQSAFVNEVPAAVSAVVNSLELKPKALKKPQVKKGNRKYEPDTETVAEPTIFCTASTLFEPKPVVRPLVSELNRKIADTREARRKKIFDFVEKFKQSLGTIDLKTPFKSRDDAMSRLLPYFQHLEPNFSATSLEKIDHDLHRHRVYNENRKNNILSSMRKIFVNEAMHGDSVIDKTMMIALDLEYEKQQFMKEKQLAAEQLQKFVDNSDVLQSSNPPSRETINIAREQLISPKLHKTPVKGFAYEPSRFDEEAVRTRKLELEAEDRREEKARLLAATRCLPSPPKIAPPPGKSPDPIIIARTDRPEKVKSIKIKLFEPSPMPQSQPQPLKRSHSHIESNVQTSASPPSKIRILEPSESRPKSPIFAVPELPKRLLVNAPNVSPIEVGVPKTPTNVENLMLQNTLKHSQESPKKHKHHRREEKHRHSRKSRHSELLASSEEPPTTPNRFSLSFDNVVTAVVPAKSPVKPEIMENQLTSSIYKSPVKVISTPLLPLSSSPLTTKKQEPDTKDPHFTSSDEDEESTSQVREKTKKIIEKTDPIPSSSIPGPVAANNPDFVEQLRHQRREEKRQDKKERRERREEKERNMMKEDVCKEQRRQERRKEKERLKMEKAERYAEAENAKHQAEAEKAQRQKEAERKARHAEKARRKSEAIEKAKLEAEVEIGQRQTQDEKSKRQAETVTFQKRDEINNLRGGVEPHRQITATTSQEPTLQPLRIKKSTIAAAPMPAEIVQTRPPLKLKLFKPQPMVLESKETSSTDLPPSQTPTVANSTESEKRSLKIKFHFSNNKQPTLVSVSQTESPAPTTNSIAPSPSKPKRKEDMTPEELQEYKRVKKERKHRKKMEKLETERKRRESEVVMSEQQQNLAEQNHADQANVDAVQESQQKTETEISEPAEKLDEQYLKKERKRRKEEKRARKQEKAARKEREKAEAIEKNTLVLPPSSSASQPPLKLKLARKPIKPEEAKITSIANDAPNTPVPQVPKLKIKLGAPLITASATGSSNVPRPSYACQNAPTSMAAPQSAERPRMVGRPPTAGGF